MIELRHISKTFPTADGHVDALRDINLTIRDGDIYGIIGMSGAGKSTLVRTINMLERPSEGSVLIDGVEMENLSPAALRAQRQKIAMIFQHFNLLMQRNCLDNVAFPLELAGQKKCEARAQARELLALVGLPEKEKSYPAELSGGQKQRVAIARALATRPKILLCDEATSALDPNTTRSILSLVADINRSLGITVIVITHQMSVVQEICRRVAILDGGEIAEEGTVGDVFTSPKSEAARRLVFPNGADELISGTEKEYRIRVRFQGAEAAGSPLIADMAIERGVRANILAASTRLLDGKIYGTMLLGIPKEGRRLSDALDYLSGVEGVVYEVLSEVGEE
mgnify:FL=1